MSNFYSDLLNTIDNVDIMDEEDLEIETDFLKSAENITVERSKNPHTRNISKSETNIYDDNEITTTNTTKSTDHFNWLLDNENEKPRDTKKQNLRFNETESDNILDDIKDFDTVGGGSTIRPKSEISRSKKENILSELFGVKDTVSATQSIPPPHPKSATNITRTMSSRKRTERRSSNLVDPLGLFSSPAKTVTQKHEEITIPTKKDDLIEDHLPDWLSGSTGSHHPQKTVTSTVISSDIPKKDKQIEIETDKISEEKMKVQDLLPTNLKSSDQSSSSLSVLHQQEAHLLLIMQLKQFEKRLIEIETRQTETIDKQQNDFNKIFNEHITNYKKSIDDQIVNQQMRLNEQMQLFVLSSSKSHGSHRSEESTTNVNQNTTKELREEFAEEIKNCQSKEYLILENSYKKQIELLEESLLSNESIFKAEISRINQYYNEQIQMYESQIESIEKKFTTKLDKLENEYHIENNKIIERYQTIIEALNVEHSKAIDNIRKCKINEHLIVNDYNSINDKLKEALEQFENKSVDILEIQSMLKNQFDVQIFEKENELKSKEKHLQSLLEKSENQNKMLANDRTKLMSLIQSLEMKLTEQNLATNESQWNLENREAKLTAREAALERESIRMKEQFDRERAYIDTMKQDAYIENEKLNTQILEARLTLAAEKSRMETEGKLKDNNSYETLKSRTEIDAAVKAAQHAIQLATDEREKLADERHHLELEKQALQSTERSLLKREDDLNNMLRQCERKKDEAAQMLNESKLLEMKYNEQHKSLQNQLASLRLREKKLTEDKVNISRERIALHKGELCPTCSTGVHSGEFKDKLMEEIGSNFIRNNNDIDLNKIKYSEDVEK